MGKEQKPALPESTMGAIRELVFYSSPIAKMSRNRSPLGEVLATFSGTTATPTASFTVTVTRERETQLTYVVAWEVAVDAVVQASTEDRNNQISCPSAR